MSEVESPSAAPCEHIVEIANVRKGFGDVQVLDGVDLNIERGHVVAIIGRSGCGKTTLLRCINGLERPGSGSVKVLGQSLDIKGQELDRLRSQVGMVFQAYNLFPHKRVLANVAIGPRRVLGMDRSRADEIAMEQLERVGLAHKASVWPSQLSGGQQQRVAIARSLAMHPKVLLLDEVTAALDPETVGDVLRVIRDLADAGMTMVLVTHEMSFAYEVADDLIFMEGGKIVERGHPRDVLTDPQDERTRSFLDRTLSRGPIGR
jgi:polar amino acid transport system ATP-binding protein